MQTLQGEVEAFERGIMLGREAAGRGARKVAAWAEENPGGLLLAGLAAGFVLGKILWRRRPAPVEPVI
jgi:hypothetical protein